MKTRRINRFHRGVALTTIVGFGLLTSACGGQWLWEVEAEKEATDVNNAQLAEIPDEEKAKSVIESVQPVQELNDLLPAENRKKLVWVTSVGYPPMENWTSDQNDVIGVDMAIAHSISRALGVSMEVENNDFNSMIPGVSAGRYDLVISSMTDNEERRQTMSFVDYVKAGNAYLVKEGNPENISTPQDVCGKTVAVVDAGSSYLLAEDQSKECEADGKPKIDILAFPGDQDARLSLESGRADATITDYPVAAYYAADDKNKLDVVAIDGDESIWGIGADKQDEELVNAVHAALQHLIDDGTYTQLLSAWNVERMAIETATVNGEEKEAEVQ